jgi:RNA polymerase sigma-70 factor (ECF subfamily)
MHILHLHLLSGLPSLRVGVVAAISTLGWRRPAATPVDGDVELLARLRAGDEEAFLELVAHHNGMLLRLAGSFVSSRAVAEEVVQDTWLGVVRGIEGFAGQSSLKTWLVRILVNRARSTGVSEGRSTAIGDAGPAVDRARFDAAGRWMSPPEHWVEDSEERLLAESLADRIQAALEELPSRQREVVMLRDVDGLTSVEVCEALAISEGNQRVLLHRGRSRLRETLEAEIRGA